MRGGSIGVVVGVGGDGVPEQTKENRNKKVEVFYAFSQDSHSFRLRSLLYQPLGGGVDDSVFGRGGGMIWSGCAGGKIIVWESYPFSVDDSVELSAFGGNLWGTLNTEESLNNHKGGLVNITIEEGFLNWTDPLLSIPFSLCLLSPSSPSHHDSCTFPHITSISLTEENTKLQIYFGKEGYIALKNLSPEKEKEEGYRIEQESEIGNVFSLYLVIRRILLSSLVAYFSSVSPSSSSSSTLTSPSFEKPTHLFPVASTIVASDKIGVEGMKEIEGNI
mmetsp:Transcript_30564/g.47526  ORF Transcript_30564/g.47526 Transcript_30564/m.47526 type:complete len:276 (-) Transcript_30564:6-833(-)